MSAHQPVGGRILTFPFLVAFVLFAVAVALLFQRFTMGLGAVANINNGYPWGLWVVLDVVIGTAFGCGGFAMAFLVYILNKRTYHPLMRPALIASMFGYTLGGLAVIFDLGRYWQVYNIFLPGYAQPNSVMLEVALCVAAYVLVLWIEFAPTFFEKMGWTGAKRTAEKWMFIFIGLGVLLPTMHQSSLGTLLVVLGYKLSPLWLTTLLPALFLISAVIMGYAIVVFESVLSSAGLKRPMETKILSRLAGIMVWVVAAYLVLRFGDLLARGEIGRAFSAGLYATLFWIENLLFVVGLALLLIPGAKTSPRNLFLSGAFLLAGGSLYRINAYLVGFDPGNGWTYFPSVSEILVTVGIFAFEVMLYLLFIKTLPVLHGLKRA